MTTSTIIVATALCGTGVGAAALALVQVDGPGIELVERYGSFGLIVVLVIYGVVRINKTLESHAASLREVAAALREGQKDNRDGQERMFRELIGGMEERTQRIIRAQDEKDAKERKRR